MLIDRFIVEEGDKKQEVFIAMTPEEAKDRSYRQYLTEAEKEKTAEQLRKKPSKPISKLSKADRIGALKELIRQKKEKSKRSVSTKYFSGNYTS